MHENILIGLAGITALGIFAQWVAWRIRLPSILVLLAFGFIAGPLTGFLNPDKLLGDLLFPVVSLSVAVILFEGGLNLRFSELKETGPIVTSMITIGVLLTWITVTLGSLFILELDFALSLLLGSILIVTGPTVIIPMLRHIRPHKRVSAIAKWEGIINDPIGAVIAVLVFEGILASGFSSITSIAIWGVLKTAIIGGVLGLAGGYLTVFLLKRYWVPDFLQETMALMFVLANYTLSNHFQSESGLLTVTIMGIFLANQKRVNIKHIAEFKENLQVLLLSGLFITLSSRLDLSDLSMLGWKHLGFLLFLMFVSRPLMIFLSTFRSVINWREKLFLAWLAPRGIVAAAITSVFAIRLEESGYGNAVVMVPLVFMIITLTVAIYGITATPFSRILNLANPNPQGAIIVGGQPWARMIGGVLKDEGFDVIVVDTNWQNISTARMSGLSTFNGSILSETFFDQANLGGIGKLLALTPNDEVNSLASLHFKDIVGASDVYQLAPPKVSNRKEIVSSTQRGRILFGSEYTFEKFQEQFIKGLTIKKTPLTKEFGYEDYKNIYGSKAIPLFLITEDKELLVFTAENPPKPRSGQTLISFVEDEKKAMSLYKV